MLYGKALGDDDGKPGIMRLHSIAWVPFSLWLIHLHDGLHCAQVAAAGIVVYVLGFWGLVYHVLVHLRRTRSFGKFARTESCCCTGYTFFVIPSERCF